MNIKLFEHHIHEAISVVPKEVRKRIENVAFVIEDDVRAAARTEKAIKSRGKLLGLYQGVPLPKRSAYYSGVLPDKITLFKHAIEHIAGPNEKNIQQLIHNVVHHEIGHYLGMNERTVRAWEQKRKKRTR